MCSAMSQKRSLDSTNSDIITVSMSSLTRLEIAVKQPSSQEPQRIWGLWFTRAPKVSSITSFLALFNGFWAIFLSTCEVQVADEFGVQGKLTDDAALEDLEL